ncbi:MAG: iron ABC transporter permease, partial [Cyclobacteriaceae bacterium]|nr:iron ABC transporter permease [Cyclobacteriaceae bacterium]
GLMMGAVTSGIVTILQYWARAEELQFFTLWTMGNIAGTGWQEIGILALMLAVSSIISLSLVKAINAWPLGDMFARSVGIHLGNTRWKVLIATSLVTGSITAFCGPIAFVGIAVPHFVRRLSPTANHQHLLPQSAVAGACLLLACDLLSQLPGEGRVLPINAITALVGAPFVIALMTGKGRPD